MSKMLRDVLHARGAGFVSCMLPCWHTREPDEDISLLKRFFTLYEKETAVSYFLQKQAAGQPEVTIEAFEMVIKTKMPKDVWTRHDEFTSEELIHIAILVRKNIQIDGNCFKLFCSKLSNSYSFRPFVQIFILKNVLTQVMDFLRMRVCLDLLKQISGQVDDWIHDHVPQNHHN